MCLYVFPKLLKEFKKHHPHVDIKVATGGQQRLLRRLRTRRADLALLTLPIDDGAFTSVPVLREELMLVMPADHPLAATKGGIPVSALVGQPFVVFEQGSNTRRTLDEFFVREQIKPRVVAETENVEIIKSMVASGLGMTSSPSRRSSARPRLDRCTWRASAASSSCARPVGSTAPASVCRAWYRR